MTQIFFGGLIVALITGVIGFGGTEPLFFRPVQIVLLGLSLLLVWTQVSGREWRPGFPLAVGFALTALVLVQLVPLPMGLARWASNVASPSRASAPAAISVAPHETLSHLLLLLTYFSGFYLTVAICQDRKAKRRLVFALLMIGLLEALYGLVQYLTNWQYIFTYKKVFNVEHATGTYINANHFAGLLEMVLPFALALSIYHYTALRRGFAEENAPAYGSTRSGEPVKALFWLFTAVILFTALVFSRSRMGIISAVLSVLALMFLVASRARRKGAMLVLAGVFLVAGVGMVLWIGPEPVLVRFETVGHELVPSTYSRSSIWQDTLHLIAERPLLGTGLGTFPVAYTAVQTSFPAYFVNHAHNDYLELVSDLGLPGGLLFFGAIGLLCVHTARRLLGGQMSRFDQAMRLGSVGAMTAILLHSLADFNLYIPANALFFAVVLGLAYSTSLRANNSADAHG